MKNIYIKKEYINHLKCNAVPLKYITLCFCLLAVIITYLFTQSIILKEKQYKTIHSNNYNYVVESSTFSSINNIYYKLDLLVTCESVNNEIIHVNTYMDLNEVSYNNSPLITRRLDENEVAISEKVAKILNLNLGDKIYLNFDIYEESIMYTVAEVIEYIDDYYDFKDDNEFSVIKIAYNDAIKTYSKGKYISFLSKQDYEEYRKENYSYSSIYNVDDENKGICINIIILNVITIIYFTLNCLLYSIFAKKLIDKEVRKYYINGYGYKATKKINLYDYLIWIILPLWICNCIFSLLYLMSKFSIFVLFEMIIISIIVSITFLCKVGKNYE